MIIAIDLGATGIKSAPFDCAAGADPMTAPALTVPTDAALGREGIVRALDRAIAAHLTDGTEGIAIASAGDVDPERACITYATGNLPGMTGFDFARYAEKYRLPVSAINDAHAALLGELYDGAARAYIGQRVAMLTLGSGVGGAYAVGGRIVATPENGFARFGHICLVPGGVPCTCGKTGCAEMYLSGRAIHRDAGTLGIDGDDLFLRYLAGDTAAVSFVGQYRARLFALLDCVRAVAPFDVCLVGGGVADWMGDAFPRITEGYEIPLVRASLGNRAGLYGAYRHFIAREGL